MWLPCAKIDKYKAARNDGYSEQAEGAAGGVEDFSKA